VDGSRHPSVVERIYFWGVATYLLKTDDERMAAYKAAAKADGVTLAEWLRGAADRVLDLDSAEMPPVHAPSTAKRTRGGKTVVCDAEYRHRSGVYCKRCGIVPK
jgi:hypothetical protein